MKKTLRTLIDERSAVEWSLIAFLLAIIVMATVGHLVGSDVDDCAASGGSYETCQYALNR